MTLSTQLTQVINALPHWQVEGNYLVRSIESASAAEAIALFNRIAELAEEANHHPDLTWSYRTLQIKITSHDTGSITERDVELAQRINQLA